MKFQNQDINDIPKQFKRFIDNPPKVTINAEPHKYTAPKKQNIDFKDTLFILLVFILFYDNI